MRQFHLLLVLVALSGALASDYTLPGVESDVINIQVNVWGDVRSPGAHMVPWDSDLRAALSAAGGPNASADLSSVRIVTPGLEIEYDLNAFLNGRGAPLPVMEPGVTIYVERSSYEWWKDVVDFSYKILIMVNVIWVMSR